MKRPGMREIARSFRAMNTDVEAIVVTIAARRGEAEKALDGVEQLFRRVDAALSRFRLDSELTALNSATGKPFHASALLFSVVSEAIAAARATDGLFDPTILGRLVAAGYDQSFELLPADRAGTPSLSGPRFDWRDIQLDDEAQTVLLPAGCGIDLGGIGKGWTVDRAAERLRVFQHFAVDAGGDIAVTGQQADRSAWLVGIEDPLAPQRDLLELPLADASIATSTIAHRHWWRGRQQQHHIIDPRSGCPAENGAIAATVIAPSTVQAETLAKATLILGAGAGIRFLDSMPEAEGIVVLEGGYIQRSAGFAELQHVA